jgi:tetratricopeptide (TPR) repeat protein
MSNSIGNCFLMEEKADSAFSYYFKALAFADSLGYEQEQAAILESLGVAYRETEDWKKAEDYFRKAWYFADDSLGRARISFNLACLFDLMGRSDSATHHIQSSLSFLPNDADNYLVANIYETWSAIYEKSGVFQEALEKYKTYSDYLVLIFDENRDRAVMEVEKKYNFQLIVTRNKQLIIERQRILLFSILLLLFFIVLFLIFYNHYKQNKRKLKETERKVRKLNELAQNFNEKENSFRNILIRHFDILKKAALLEGYLKEDEKRKGKLLLQKFNEVVYGEKNLNWDLLYETLNSLSNNFFNRLRNKFPQLDESEFRICCLLAVDFSNTEIAIILNYSINTVQAKRSVIRKKLGIKPFGNIRDFLNTVLKTS